jgi:hypothetical protein
MKISLGVSQLKRNFSFKQFIFIKSRAFIGQEEGGKVVSPIFPVFSKKIGFLSLNYLPPVPQIGHQFRKVCLSVSEMVKEYFSENTSSIYAYFEFMFSLI